ncbi:uncharacterized protein LOC128547969 [Mercenaria mercenaria]|uniref:uncharacterized protein LOC128547969 n=1 Tax=Mercenaria mercenaria TaxID=6596 RepID=UPI00234F484A|nr:uncharacterized protein LOC128547969 [Mercenaria mercenaria]
MDDHVRMAGTGGMEEHGTVDNAGDIDDHVTLAYAEAVDDDGKINDVCVKGVPFNWKGSNKPENTDFSVKTWKEDLTLLVENKKLYVSKAVLGLVSPVFDRMFQSEFKEGHQTEIELPDKKLDDVKEFLRCIYPNMENDVSEKNVYTILSLADEYEYNYGRQLSVSVTPVNMNGVETISLILKIVLIKALKKERDVCRILKENISPRSKPTSWRHITLDEKENFSHFAKVDSEIHVLAYKGHSLLYDHFLRVTHIHA